MVFDRLRQTTFADSNESVGPLVSRVTSEVCGQTSATKFTFTITTSDTRLNSTLNWCVVPPDYTTSFRVRTLGLIEVMREYSVTIYSNIAKAWPQLLFWVSHKRALNMCSWGLFCLNYQVYLLGQSFRWQIFRVCFCWNDLTSYLSVYHFVLFDMVTSSEVVVFDFSLTSAVL